MSAPTTLADLREYMRDTIARIGEAFTEPDDDWMSVCCLQHADGLVIVALDGQLFASELRKDVLAETLRRAIVQVKAFRYALLLNTHMAVVDNENTDRVGRGIRVEQLPNAREMLVLLTVDAEQEQASSCLISRDGVNPPSLEGWKDMEEFVGRFANLNERMRDILKEE